MKRLITIIALFLLAAPAFSQDTLRFKNQYKAEAKGIEVQFNGVKYMPDAKGELLLKLAPQDSILVSGKDYDAAYFSLKNADENKTISLHKKFSWTDLLTPMFYIISGGIWFILFVVFAETGLFAGFFLPGDSLLFVTGIYSSEIVQSGMGISGAGSFIDLLILGILISIAGILGNFVGYWFGRKSGPFLFERKDTFFFRKKYLYQAKDFYDKHGGGAVVIARFLPIIRTFAPIVAGIVGMEKKKFTYYNIVGCLAWVFTMLFAGHYLEQLFLHAFNFDLKEHLEVIVIGIVLVTTAPILIKLIFGKNICFQHHRCGSCIGLFRRYL
jgi:membrane-associated protein